MPEHVARIDRIFAEAVGRDLSSWERFTFLPSIRKQMRLTTKQANVLADIERRLNNGHTFDEDGE